MKPFWLLKIFAFFSFVLCQDLFCKLTFLSKDSALSIKKGSQLFLNQPISDVGVLKLEDSVESSIFPASSDCILSFSQEGSLVSGGHQISMQGKIDPSLGALVLDGNKKLFFQASSVINQPLLIKGQSNYLRGSCLFDKPIYLFDSSSELFLGLNTKLTQDLSLNGGSLHLLSDLYLKDDVLIHGPGIIYLNGFSLRLPSVLSRPMDSDLIFVNANDLAVPTRTVLTSAWTFTGTGLSSSIIGYGVVLDMRPGAAINVGANHTLYINNLHIKSLGSVTGGRISLSTTSKVYLTNCILDLYGGYTLTAGQMIVDGAYCKIVSGSTEKFYISGAGTQFIVDRTVLEYDSLNQLPSDPFTLISGGTFLTTNGGELRSSFKPGSSFALSAYIGTAQGVNYCDTDIYLTSNGTLTFYNENIAVAKTMILDCKGNTINFGDGAALCFVIQQNVTLIVRNARFKNFDMSKISFGGSGGTLAKINFEDNVFLEIGENQSFTTRAINLTGTGSEIVGTTYPMLTLSSKMLNISGTNASVRLKNLRLKCLAYDSIKWLSSTVTTSFDGTDLYLTKTGLTCDLGNLAIVSESDVAGYDETNSNALVTAPFNFTSPGKIFIESGATYHLRNGIIFNYSPNVSGDGGSTALFKRHIKLVDPTSAIKLGASTLDCTGSGIAFDYGLIYIDQTSTFSISSRAGADFELGTAANLSISNASVLNVTGPIKYVPSTYP